MSHCSSCVLPGVFAASPCVAFWKRVAGTIRAMERKREIRWNLLGRSMGGLFQVVFLFLDLKSLPLAPLCGQNLPFLIPHIVGTQLFLPILRGLEGASSGALHATPPLPELPPPCWTWHFARGKPATNLPYHDFLVGRTVLSSHTWSKGRRESKGLKAPFSLFSLVTVLTLYAVLKRQANGWKLHQTRVPL